MEDKIKELDQSVKIKRIFKKKMEHGEFWKPITRRNLIIGLEGEETIVRHRNLQ